MYQVAVCICNFMVSSVTMSGCPGWLSHLPVMTETPASGVSMCHSPCGKPKHDQHVWVTQMAESPPCHDRVPLLQVSPCVTPHVANQNMTSNETDIDIKDITGFHEKCRFDFY